MKINKRDMRLYAVTDGKWTTDISLCEQVEQAILGGATFVQLREKNIDDNKYTELAGKVKKVTDKYNVPLIIDDRVYVALNSGAAGVHLGQNDMSISKAREILGEKAIIGATAKTTVQAVEAESQGADYIGCGAAFPTSTKTDTWVIDHNEIRNICKKTDIPVVAIGGINENNICSLKGLGLSGVAVVSALFSKTDVLSAAKNLRKLSDSITGTKKVLTIAGSDCSGGAGIQADLKTISAFRMYGMSVITALTAQNTTGVYGVSEIAPDFVEKQIDCVFDDIRPDSVKIGMVSDPEIIRSVCKKLIEKQAENIVVDPVMISTSGSRLLKEEAMKTLIDRLIPLGDIITPNIPEAMELSGISIKNRFEMTEAAKIISEQIYVAREREGISSLSHKPVSVLIKGGHSTGDADDLLYLDEREVWIQGERIENNNVHGTGCTLSSAIACNMADGFDIENSVRRAKEYLSKIIGAKLNLGRGNGPLEHTYTDGF